jgi:hypothetical protein
MSEINLLKRPSPLLNLSKLLIVAVIPLKYQLIKDNLSRFSQENEVD